MCGGSDFYELEYCINHYLDNNAFRFYDCYVMFKKGIMPTAGGYLDQSNSFIQHLQYLDRVQSKYDAIREKRNGGRSRIKGNA